MASKEEWAQMLEYLTEMEKDVDTQQLNVYIVAGVLGGVVLFLMFGVIALILMIARLKTKLQMPETKKNVGRNMENRQQPNHTTDLVNWQGGASAFENSNSVYEHTRSAVNRFTSPAPNDRFAYPAGNNQFMSSAPQGGMPPNRYYRY